MSNKPDSAASLNRREPHSLLWRLVRIAGFLALVFCAVYAWMAHLGINLPWQLDFMFLTVLLGMLVGVLLIVADYHCDNVLSDGLDDYQRSRRSRRNE